MRSIRRGTSVVGAVVTSRWCTVDGVDVAYTDTGCGPTVLFVHGVYVTGAIWDDVTAVLGDRYRCVVPTWPHGGHSRPAPEADLSAPAAARRIVHLLERLDLTAVTIVANDTGGGLLLIALAEEGLDTSRITGLVFTNGDSYEHFPPKAFRPLVRASRASSSLGAVLLWLLSSPWGRRGFLKVVCRRPVTAARAAEVFGSFSSNGRTRRDGIRLTASLTPALTMAAAPAITAWTTPVRVVWGGKDRLFPISHGRRLQRAFPRAELVVVPAASTYVMLDAPHAVAQAIVDLQHDRPTPTIIGKDVYVMTTASSTPDDPAGIGAGLGSTALLVAAQRAMETTREDALFDDPYSQVLVTGTGPGVWTHMLADGFLDKIREVDDRAGAYFAHMGNYQAVRTHFFDRFFTDTATDVRQVVILAAGLDARAYRLPWPPGTTVFEVDLPHVLAYKAAMLAASGATPTTRHHEVPVDLRGEWPTALRASGFDPSTPTAWLAEGLLMYLPAQTQDQLLEQIDELSAPGSHLAAECLNPNAAPRRTQMRDAFTQLAAKFGANHTEDVGDLMYDDPDRADLEHWLTDHHWTASATSSTTEMQRLGRWDTSQDPHEDAAFAAFVVGRRDVHPAP